MEGWAVKFLRGVMILVIVLALTVLIAGGFWIYRGVAPVPQSVAGPTGETLTTASSIRGGQAVYQKYGLMDYGSVLGEGAYLGRDFTAEGLHRLTESLRDWYAVDRTGRPYAALSLEQRAGVDAIVQQDLKTNRYDPATGRLVLSAAEVRGFEDLRAYVRGLFTAGEPQYGLPAGTIRNGDLPAAGRAWVAEGDQLNQLSDFFFWTAWLSAAERPGTAASYTNNWPYDAAAGNTVPAGAIIWSAVSVAALVLGLGLIFYLYQRYELRMKEAPQPDYAALDPTRLRLTPSQVKTGKFFLVVAALFVVQTLLGALLAHFYVQGDSFYGLDLARLLPFNIARTWHLQLAIFWIATAWLALGIFVAPKVTDGLTGGGDEPGGDEPRGDEPGGAPAEPRWQGRLVDLLFWALVLVVVGSLAGEWLGTRGYLGNFWWLLGQQGYEYLELGRVWQVLLAVGLAGWLFILFRGLRPALKAEEDRLGLVHLLIYSAVAIPAFYVAAFFINPGVNITFADYWRWWTIHLWVEGVFEVFAVVVTGYLMTAMGLVEARSTARALYFQLTILLGSGVIGTGHHFYWTGAPHIWMALGAVFSALEVIPLTLLVYEAYGHYRAIREGGRTFPYHASFLFLIGTGFWNLVGAGALGFLINLPAVNYFEHGTFLTAAHAHAALFGVYGMFALALLLYVLRNLAGGAWNDRLPRLAFWGLNGGLAGMLVLSVLPVGFIQVSRAIEAGFWAARDPAFYHTPVVGVLLWWRLVPDTVFIVLGALPILWVAARVFLSLGRRPAVGAGAKAAGAASPPSS